MNSVKMSKPGSNIFDLTHDKKLSCQMGQLVPVMLEPTLPGDRFGINCESLLRLPPLIAPMMHRLDVTVHYFFVPNRLVWPGREDFITNGGDQPDTPLPVPPAAPFITVDDDGSTYNALMDYMGIPPPTENPTADTPENISALPFAAYQLIWNEYYRDQNLIPEEPLELVDGDNSAIAGDLGLLRQRAWEHDYFTSALPFAQKGAGVEIPLAGFQDMEVKHSRTDTDPMGAITTTGTIGGGTDIANVPRETSDNPLIPFDSLYADTSQLAVGSTTINDLRRAFRLQEWLEKAARGGSRYIEQIRSFFGVKSSDQRLNRPEYITGSKSPVIISEVLNTSDTDTAPQGTMSGHAIGVTNGKYGSYFCEEHGYIMGIMSVMPKTAYFQGVPKHWLKTEDAFQYYFPQFANIGEQEILNKEIYADGSPAGEEVFGYIPRYSEYKFMPNRVAGEFKTTLLHWHLARDFASAPQLNQEFISASVTDRIFAVTDEAVDNLYCHVLHKIKAVRPMPKYGSPSF